MKEGKMGKHSVLFYTVTALFISFYGWLWISYELAF